MPATGSPRKHTLDLTGASISAVVVLIAAVLPLLWNDRHYFVDDSVNGAFGQWYHLGRSLLEGRVPLLEPTSWSSGNLMAEGQWGFFNPLVLVIAVGSTLAGDAAVFTTVVKIVAIVFGAIGVYALARGLGARPPFAAVASTAAPFTGFTTYFDAPSWVTGLFAWALVPWFLWFLMRFRRGSGPVLLLVTGYLIITIGYVHGTIAVALLIGTALARDIVARRWRDSLRLFAAGTLLGLVALATHVTSLMTASVTNRNGNAVMMDQFMALDLSGLAMSPISTALPQVASWWWPGFTAPVPLAYISIALPLIALVRWRRLFRISPDTVIIAAAGVVFLAFIMLPTVIGPLRYPTRMLPYLALCALVVLAVGLDRAFSRSRERIWACAVLVFVPAFLAWAQYPQIFKRLALSTLFVVVAVTLVLARSRRRSYAAPVAAVIILFGMAAFTVQQAVYPRSIWADQYVPTKVADLQTQLSESVGDTIVIGDPLGEELSPELWTETLFANTWYVNPQHVINRYQLLGFGDFNSTVCLGYLGETCPDLADSLFDRREDTGLTLADELAISSVQIIKSEETERYLDAPPSGWRVADDGRHTQLWVREEPVAGAGGVVASGGAEVSDEEVTPERLTFEVSNSGTEPARIVTSRLAWPGYTVDGARFDEPADGFLLSVVVPPGHEGRVTIQFRPAGIGVAVASLLTAAVATAAWSLLRRFPSRPRRLSSERRI